MTIPTVSSTKKKRKKNDLDYEKLHIHEICAQLRFSFTLEFCQMMKVFVIFCFSLPKK